MRRWRGDVMHLSPLLQGGSSVWSHLMKINLILSLSHLPRIETSAAVSDNCSCWKLSSYDTCALRASALMRVWVSSEALVRPVFSGHFYTTLSPGNGNVFPLCFPKRSVMCGHIDRRYSTEHERFTQFLPTGTNTYLLVRVLTQQINTLLEEC